MKKTFRLPLTWMLVIFSSLFIAEQSNAQTLTVQPVPVYWCCNTPLYQPGWGSVVVNKIRFQASDSAVLNSVEIEGVGNNSDFVYNNIRLVDKNWNQIGVTLTATFGGYGLFSNLNDTIFDDTLSIVADVNLLAPTGITCEFIIPNTTAVTVSGGVTLFASNYGAYPIWIGYPPVASFDLSTTQLCPWQPLHIDDISTPGSNPVSYNWYFEGPTNIWNGTWDSVDVPDIVWQMAGNYNISLSLIDIYSGSQSFFDQEVTVWPTPNVWITNSSQNLNCQNPTVTLTATGTGMSWTWNNQAGDTLGTADTLVVSTPGYYWVSASNPGGCSTTTSTYVGQMSVPYFYVYGDWNSLHGDTMAFCQSNTNPWIGVSNYCQGCGQTLIWNDGSTDPQHSVTTSGTYTAIITDGYGCSTSVSTVVIIDSLTSTPVIISGPLEFCDGGSVTLTGPSTGYSDYFWNNGQHVSQITVDHTFDAAFTVTDYFGCTATTPYFSVIVDPVPPVPLVSASGNGCELASSSQSGNQWSYYNVPISGATNQFYNPQGVGFYSVEVTNAYGCTNTSQPFYSDCSMTGIPDIVVSTVTVIQDGNQVGVFLPHGESYTISLWNNIGQQVFLEETSQNTVLPTANLAAGVYMVRAENDANTITKEVVIAH